MEESEKLKIVETFMSIGLDKQNATNIIKNDKLSKILQDVILLVHFRYLDF